MPAPGTTFQATSAHALRAALQGARLHFEEIASDPGAQDDAALTALAANNLSVVQGELAGLETTREGRRGLLEQAVDAVEESVRLHRGLGLRGELATALTNASTLYSALTVLETTREGRRGLLEQAVGAVEESVRLYRDLGVQGDLAMSLGAATRHYRAVAGEMQEPAEALRWLLQSLAAIREAVALFREVGERPFYLLSLQDALVTLLQLASNGGAVDPSEIESLCDEGIGRRRPWRTRRSSGSSKE